MNLKKALSKAKKLGHEFAGECNINNQVGYICVKCEDSFWEEITGFEGTALRRKCNQYRTPFSEKNCPTKKTKSDCSCVKSNPYMGMKTKKRCM